MADIITDGQWAGFDRERAFEWSTYFYDQPPSFPDAATMASSYRAHRENGFVGLGSWADTARRAEAAGFTPAMYAVLRHHLATRSAEDPIDFAVWVRWPELVRSGYRPSHATQIIREQLNAP